MKKSKFLSSLKHAMRGLHVVFASGRNFRIQTFTAVLILCAGTLLRVAVWEYILLILLSASVLVLELFNTVIERMSDGLQPRLSVIVRDIKDLMAGAVLIVSFVSAIIGVVIFLPYIVELVSDLNEAVPR